ncbi:MAG: MFS transporter [Pseudomonadota bacterium]
MKRLGFDVLAAYAAPALPMAALYFPVYVLLAPAYAASHGLSLSAIGSVFVLVRLLDAVTDPAMGWLSDRLRLRLGRRRPWILAATPIIMLAAWQVFAPTGEVTLTSFALWLALLTVGWTMFFTPYFAWGAELSGDYTERSRVTIWREAVTLVGTIVAAIVYDAGGGGAEGLSGIALFVLILLPIAVGFAVARVPEPVDYSRTRADLRSLLATLKQEPVFLRLLGAYFINGASNAIPAALVPFFVEYRLGATGQVGLFLVLYFGAGAVFAPFWLWCAGRFAKHRTWCLAMLYASAVFLSVLLLGSGDTWAFAAICVLSGAALGADLALPSSIQADVVDLDTVRSGTQRTGAFFALWSVATKAALALAGGAALIAAGFVGFDPSVENTEEALFGLAALYALAPVALKLVAVAMMWGFPHDAARQAEVRAEIERRGGTPAASS